MISMLSCVREEKRKSSISSPVVSSKDILNLKPKELKRMQAFEPQCIFCQAE